VKNCIVGIEVMNDEQLKLITSFMVRFVLEAKTYKILKIFGDFAPYDRKILKLEFPMKSPGDGPVR
jgi:hypothetical protein